MIQKQSLVISLLSLVVSFCLAGCAHSPSGNEGQLQSYVAPTIEVGWIRDGQPIEYANQRWYPVNDVETLLDSEVYQVGEYKGVQVFIDKVDTKPYHRLYTKFAKNKFRYFETRNND